MGEFDDDAAGDAVPGKSGLTHSGGHDVAQEFDRTAEIEVLFETDETVLGEVWRESRAGTTPAVSHRAARSLLTVMNIAARG